MQLLKEVAGLIGGIFVFFAFIPYIVSIIRGETKPNRVSWILWAIIGFLDVIAYFSLGAVYTMWIPVLYFLFPLVVAILSFKYNGKAGATPADGWCMFGASVGLILWWYFQSALVGLISFMVVDLFAMLPTVIKSYLRPWEESKLAWTLASVGNLINLFPVTEWNLDIVLLPLYYVFQTVTISFLLWFSPKSR